MNSEMDEELRSYLESIRPVVSAALDRSINVRRINDEHPVIQGTIDKEIRKIRPKYGMTRRSFLSLGGIFSISSFRTYGAGIGTGLSANFMYDVLKSSLYSEHSDERNNYSLSRDFVQSVALKPFSSSEIAQITPRSIAEAALLKSYTGYRTTQDRIKSVIDNTKLLLKSTEYNEDANIRCILLSRAAIDMYSICDIDTAKSILKSIDYNSLSDDYALIAFLEYSSTISNNSISYSNFTNFDDEQSLHLASLWDDYSNKYKDPISLQLNSNIGISMSSALQAKFIRDIYNLAGDYEKIRKIHDEWFNCRRELYKNQLKYGVYAKDAISDNDSIAAEDYILSLTRLSYHMSATGSRDLALSILNETTGVATSKDPAMSSAVNRQRQAPSINFRWACLLREFLQCSMHSEITGEFVNQVFDGIGARFPIFDFARDRIRIAIGVDEEYSRHHYASGMALYSSYIEVLKAISVGSRNFTI